MRFFSKPHVSFGRRLAACLLAGAALVAVVVANADPAFATLAPQVNLAGSVEFIEDAEGKLTLADVTGEAASRFRPVAAKGNINLSYSSSTFWLRFPLKGDGAGEQRLLEVAFFKLSQLTFHAPGRPPVVTGQSYPVSSRAWPHRFYVFPVTLTDEPRYHYLQVRSQEAMIVPLTLWEPAAFAAHTEKTYLAVALNFGVLLALMIYNFLVFTSLRERSFLLYTLLVGCWALVALTNNGIGRQFLWPDGPAWISLLPISLLSLKAVFDILFSQRFLQTGVRQQTLHRALSLAAVIFLLFAMAPFLGVSARATAQVVALGTIVSCGLIVAAGVQALRAGNTSARVFLLAFGVLWIGTLAAGMRKFDWLPASTLTGYALQIGSAVQLILLSFALAERIRLERDAKEAAQADALSARQSLVETLQQSEVELEKIVAERTTELKKSLKNEQNILERYIRFGSLISHEFRNPLAIIKSQLVLIEKEKQHGVDHAERRLSAISGAAKRLGSLFEEWLQSDRIRQQTQAIAPAPLNLKPWLDEILADCRVCYADHPFELRFSSEFPRVPADESLLRIALLNLIDNATKYAPPGTEISIECIGKDDMVGIAVTDRGPGVPPEHREDVFSAYFRGDPHGTAQGLGLGMAFVKKIVDMHRGEIDLQSEMGKGSRICIWLPCGDKAQRHE